jgi:hypothetical protein
MLQRGAAFRERGAAFRALISAEAICLCRGRWRLRCWIYSERENQYGNDGDGGRNPPRGGTPHRHLRDQDCRRAEQQFGNGEGSVTNPPTKKRSGSRIHCQYEIASESVWWGRCALNSRFRLPPSCQSWRIPPAPPQTLSGSLPLQ